MNVKRVIKEKSVEAWRFFSVYSGFSRRNKIIYNSTYFEKSSLTKDEKKEYYEYWKSVSPIISLKTVEITKSISGIFDKKIVPEEFLPLYIAPTLNSDRRIQFFENKSIYNKWFGLGVFPKDFFHKLDNSYYTYEFKVIEDIEKFIDNKITEIDFPIVIKPNKDTHGGQDINFVNNKDEMKEVIKNYSDLVVQEKIEQSNLINVFSKESINTVRVCLYKDNNDVMHVINATIRMGVNGSLDNLTAGGIACNINPNGILNDYANGKYGKKYLEHPNSGFVFKNEQFPMYKDLIEVSKEVARDILGARLISIDMLLDSNNKWRCIEVNLGSQTMFLSQYAGQPFLGEHTDEVIKNIHESQYNSIESTIEYMSKSDI